MNLPTGASGPAVALIIPVFNSRGTVLALIRHLAELNEVLPAEIVVVDDGSTDGTTAAIHQEFPAVTVVAGTGSLWWTGGIRLGMEQALQRPVEYLFWLNHDCRPEPGTLTKLLMTVLPSDSHIACAGAQLYLQKHPTYFRSPGFLHHRALVAIPRQGLREADGLNGNCVCFRANAVRQVGLPDAQRFPHYGDGPYTFRFRQAGYRVVVNTDALAAQEHELERCLPLFWRAALAAPPRGGWWQFYWLSPRSYYQWRFRWHRMWCLRGAVALLTYPLGQLALVFTLGGALVTRRVVAREKLLQRCTAKLPPAFPREGLRRELGWTASP